MSRTKSIAGLDKVPRRLKKMREESNVSQVELAEALGISQPMVSKYEAGIDFPSSVVFLLYAKHFGTSIEWILTGKKNGKVTID